MNTVQKLPQQSQCVYPNNAKPKQMGDALLRENNLLHTLIDQLPDYVYIKDRNSQFLLANRATLNFVGVETVEDVIGKSDFDFFPHKLATRFYHNEQQLLKTGRVLTNLEATLFDQETQTTKWVSTDKFPYRDEHGTIVGLIGISRDITVCKLREQAVEQQLLGESTARYKFGDLIGKSRHMQHVYNLILKAATTNAHVLITGESGTGKELVARMIHEMSVRKDKPFIPVNCGAIPDTLFESICFGYRKGAFTDAKQDKQGLFTLAHQGTLFLDEVGEIPLAMQIKLLRVIEGHGYFPIGGHIIRYADVRIIAATNQHVTALQQSGMLREDFLYRINVIPITLPPLRERRDDIPLLVEHFLNQHHKTSNDLSDDQLTRLYHHAWPGNVRELQNVIERLVLGISLKIEPIPVSSSAKGLQTMLDEVERRIITETLLQNYGHKTKTAQQLHISVKTLYRKLKKYHLSTSNNGHH